MLLGASCRSLVDVRRGLFERPLIRAIEQFADVSMPRLDGVRESGDGLFHLAGIFSPIAERGKIQLAKDDFRLLR